MMARRWIASQAGVVLPIVGVVLALANWNLRPDKALAWLVATAIFVVMIGVRHVARLALRRSSADPGMARNLAATPRAVAMGALMMVIPLGVSLADAYGFVDDREGGIRGTMIILGLYLAATGNALPRMLPPSTSMKDDASRIQAFQRFAGWTWVVCGLLFAATWLALPTDVTVPVSVAVVLTALIASIVQLLRLRKPRGTTLPA